MNCYCVYTRYDDGFGGSTDWTMCEADNEQEAVNKVLTDGAEWENDENFTAYRVELLPIPWIRGNGVEVKNWKNPY